jgi:hypothetical protein
MCSAVLELLHAKGRRIDKLTEQICKRLKNLQLRLREPGQLCRYSYWLRAGRLWGQSSSTDSVKNFFHVVQTDSEAHPASYPMVTGGSFPGGKAAEV